MIFTKREIILSIVLLIVFGLILFSVYNTNSPQKVIIDQDNDENKSLDDNLYENDINSKKMQDDTSDNELIDKTIMIDICGAVANEGVVSLNEGDRVIDAIERAGGLTQDADIKRINRAKQIFDGEKIIIPRIGEKIDNNDIVGVNDSIKATNDGRININTANKEELKTLKGIGDVIADRIIEYRKNNNGFSSIEEIINVKRIGDKTFENIKDYIKVH